VLLSVPLADAKAATTPTAPAPPAEGQAIEPEAKATLARMSDYLRTLQVFHIHAASTKDDIVQGDFKVQKAEVVDVTVRRPDRLRADVTGDERTLQLFFDGKTLTLFSPVEKYYATMTGGPTIADAMKQAMARYGIELPLADFLYTAAGGDLAQGATKGGYIGPSTVDGAPCEHIAFRDKNGVDWQVWVEKGDKPLPRKIVITTRTQPTAPQYTAVLTWDLAPKIDEAMFAFTPPADAKPVAFAQEVQPPKTQPSKTK
jgi:hypothetical protein